MSILLKAPIKKTGLITKSKHVGPKTSSILLVSAAILIAVVLLMYAGIAFTEGSMKGYSECRDKIVGFEQKGIYGSPNQFKLALSYCDSK
jgi:hypothetical protein